MHDIYICRNTFTYPIRFTYFYLHYFVHLPIKIMKLTDLIKNKVCI